MKTGILLFATLFISTFMTKDNSVHQFTMKNIEGKDVSLADYKGKAIMIVNVASKCGYTPQYEDLQKLYEKYADRDFVILGFPANNFMGQEPGTNAEIQSFCKKNYGVTFPMFSKISVKGNDQAELYKFLTKKERNGVMDSKVKWNFQKYLLDKEGVLTAKFAPGDKPLDDEIISAIEKLI